jgi:hypothetical protein
MTLIYSSAEQGSAAESRAEAALAVLKKATSRSEQDAEAMQASHAAQLKKAQEDVMRSCRSMWSDLTASSRHHYCFLVLHSKLIIIAKVNMNTHK